MEVINPIKRKDNQLLVVTHLSQLLSCVTGFGGLIVPLIIWVTQKNEVDQMDEQGKEIINFQISLIVYALICIPLCLIIIGIFGLIILGIISFIMPIINAINASNGGNPKYPLTIRFIS